MNTSVFDTVKSVLTDAAQVVGQKSGELIDASKTKYAIFELKKEIKKLYSEIGKMEYQSYIEGVDNSDDVKLKCGVIKAKYAKIRILESGTENIDFNCPECGCPNSADAEYCSSCGADMTVDVHGAVEYGDEV